MNFRVSAAELLFLKMFPKGGDREKQLQHHLTIFILNYLSSFCSFSHELEIYGPVFVQQVKKIAKLITIQLEENELPHCNIKYF